MASKYNCYNFETSENHTIKLNLKVLNGNLTFSIFVNI